MVGTGTSRYTDTCAANALLPYCWLISLSWAWYMSQMLLIAIQSEPLQIYI